MHGLICIQLTIHHHRHELTLKKSDLVAPAMLLQLPQIIMFLKSLKKELSLSDRHNYNTHPNMAAVCLVFCCGGVEVLVDNKISVPAFSQSKASFSVMPLSFMLFSKTDIISWNRFTRTISGK